LRSPHKKIKMLRHTLKIIVRRLNNQKLFTGIHLIGLTVGISSCLLIYLFIQHEVSYDAHHHDVDRIYRINTQAVQEGTIQYSMNAAYPMAEALRSDFPDWESIGGMHWQADLTVRKSDGELATLDEGMYAEPELLEILRVDMLQGDPQRALAEPDQILLSSSLSNTLFGTDKSTGEILRLNDTTAYEVAGVYEDFVATTHFPAQYIVSYKSLTSDIVGFDITSWGVTISGSVYAKLPADEQPETYETRLAQFVKKYMYDEEGGTENTLVMQAVRDIHFDTRFGTDSSVRPINPSYLWISACIGLLILLMACFNFLNLSLAQSLKKSTEAGIRKVLGADRSQLWGEHFGEAAVLTLLAFGFSLVAVQFFLPKLNLLLNKAISWTDSSISSIAIFSIVLLLGMSLLAGAYPAWIQSRHRPADVLKGSKTVGNRNNNRLRQFTVLAQFVITLGIIVSAITVARQLHHIQSKDLGFSQEAIVQIGLGEPGTNAAFRTEIEQLSGVLNTSFAIGAPTSFGNIHTSLHPFGRSPKDNTVRIGLKAIDQNYGDLYDLKLLSGRYINHQDVEMLADGYPRSGQKCNVVVNKKLLDAIGVPSVDEAIGQRLILGINSVEATIVGVVDNFHTSSLYESVEPVLLMPMSPLCYELGVKVEAGTNSELLAKIEEVYNQFYPNDFFEYNFLDESIAEQYLSEERLYTLLKIFGGLAIFIACLGLFGLATLTSLHRRKEISLRKILGASVGDILTLLSIDTLRLIAIALLVATPLSWWVMYRWLNSFAYRINISWWTFALAGAILLLIAIVTISGQALRAAVANPADSMRQE
jgi:putative ABC transport system permease protein